MSRSVRIRAFRRAARAWDTSHPHRALVILTEAGCREYWPEFVAQALRRRREHTVRLLTP